MIGHNRYAKNAHWVIVANELQASVYARDTRREPLKEMFSMHNELGRKKTQEILSDRDGRSFDSFGNGRHAITNEKSGPRQHAAQVFATQIAQRISQAVHERSCRDYALIAAPKFLGLLRQALTSKCTLQPSQSVAKDVVDQDTTVLQNLLDSK